MSDKKWDRIPGPSRLARWRSDAGLTQQQAADLIGTDLASYNAFENARERPGLDYAVAIERVTKGRVEPRHWADDVRREPRKAS